MNKTVIFNKLGGPEVLEIENIPITSPKENEITIKISSCGLNRAEYLFFQGQYLFTPTLSSKLGLEASGVVHATSATSSYKVGDKVCILPSIDLVKYGCLGEYVNIPEMDVIAQPAALDDHQAAAFWMAYGTAYGLLIQEGKLTKDDNKTVLITAASSSVGLASIQIAKSLGASVIATTRTSSKKKFLLDAGADHVIVTSDESIAERVSEITDGRGFDICIDAVAGPQMQNIAEAAGVEARVIIYGILDFNNFEFPLFPVLGKGLKISGFHYVFHLLNHADRKRDMLHFLHDGLESNTYQIMIDKMFSLDEVKEAYSYMESNQQRGKIIINIS